MNSESATVRQIDIAPAELETVRRILCEHMPGLEVRVFGSRVSWATRATSDLDLALMTDETLCIDHIAELKASFTKSDLPFRVDIVDWASTSESFREVIERDHVVLALIPVKREVEHAEWHETNWGSIATLEYGCAIRSYETAQGSFRVFGTNGPIGWHNEALCKCAGVIVGRKGAYRCVHYSPDPFLS